MYIVRIQERSESTVLTVSGVCVFLALVCLVLAAAVPRFVVTSFQGQGKILIAEFNVDLSVGQGLWRRDVCFGVSQPDEELLNQVGLSCKGSLQTAHCDSGAELTDKEQDRCDQYTLMQAMQITAIFFTFVAIVLGSIARSCASSWLLSRLFRLGTFLVLGAAVTAANIVIGLVNESDMVKDVSFSCSDIFGAELCRGYGASYSLQWISVSMLLLALLLNLAMVCVGPAISSSTTYQYVRVPLLHEPVRREHGVVISIPSSVTAPQAAASMI